MLLVPPRHGKSELASRRFPAYFLGRHSHKQFISASASSLLAEDFGRDVRNIIASDEYRCLFNTSLAEDSKAKGRWNTTDGGAYYAVGVNSAVMGRGAHVFMIDDPFGTMSEARSALTRKSVFDWYTGTVYNRLEERGAIVLINHRMHEADLTGMLLEQQAAGGDKWEVVELKPDLENGIALWPEKYPVDVLDRIRRNTTPQDWSALYLQSPSPEEGDYWKSEWFKPCRLADLPPHNVCSTYGASDYAVTSGGGDYTVHGVVSIDANGEMWLRDVWRKQVSSDVWVEKFCDLVLLHKPLGWAEETGQIKSGVGPFLSKRQIERKAFVYREQFPTRGDKGVRAQSMRGRVGLMGLHVPTDAPWYSDLMTELLSIPSSKTDDQHDMLGLIGQLLDKMLAGEPAKKPPPKEDPSGYSDRDNDDDDKEWMAA